MGKYLVRLELFRNSHLGLGPIQNRLGVYLLKLELLVVVEVDVAQVHLELVWEVLGEIPLLVLLY